MSFFMIGTSPKTLNSFTLHAHSCYEIILNLEGEGINVAGNAETPFRRGSICIIPPNTPHTKRSAEGFRDIYIQADGLDLPVGHGTDDAYLCLEDDKAETLSRLMQMMLCRYVERQKEDATLLLMYELVVRLLREKCTAPINDALVDEMRRRMALHFNDPDFSLSELLAKTGYDKDYARRRFVTACGVTPGEYLLGIRIEHAKKLLAQRQESRLSVADIGALCGYYDARYFSRIFKKAVGISPTQYTATV